MSKSIPLSSIRIDGGTQSRVGLNQDTVTDYQDAYEGGAKFPPVMVFFDGADRWLADGFHRFFGAKAAGLTEIEADETAGTQRDAILHSLGANAAHGLRRTAADKRKAVDTLLADPEWTRWSNREIARACHVSPDTVDRARRDLTARSGSENTAAERTFTNKHGSTSVMKTAKIGRGNPEQAPDQPAPNAPKSVAPAAPTMHQAPAADPNGLTPEEMAAASDDFDPLVELEALQNQVTDLLAQLAAVQADDPGAEALKWRRQAEQAFRSRDEAMKSSQQSQERERFAMKQLRRCGAAVGVDDPRNIPLAVEKMAAQVKAEAS